jgi:class 3 adenylate cyclase
VTDEELIALGLGGTLGNDAPVEEFLTFIRWLLDRGAAVDQVRSAAALGINHLFALRDELLYLGPATLSAEELAERVGASVEEMSDWWRLLRLGALATSEQRFSESDVALMWVAHFYMRMLPTAHARDALRVLGAGMEQITLGLRDVWRIAVDPPVDRDRVDALKYNDIAEAMADSAKQWLPSFLFSLYWRHTAAAVADNPVVIDDYRTAEAEITVLFVDIVDFTRLARRVDSGELTAIVAAFEQAADRTAHDFGGRLVKMLGDGAMFQFGTPRAAIAAAEAFVGDHPDLPPRRAAVATGRAVSRQGDFFGPVVNLAARLVSVAAAGEVVIDHHAEDGPAVERLGPVVLKGYDEPVTPYRLVP